jgi:peptide/nickel transport system permease protein
MPVFWQGLMMILMFALWLGWLPPSGRPRRLGLLRPADHHARHQRHRRDHAHDPRHDARDAQPGLRPHGALEGRLRSQHRLPARAAQRHDPVVTVIGLQFGGLLSGAVITETIFSWPGIGRLAVDAIRSKDFPVVQGVVMVFAIMYALVNLFTDVLYAYLDPRLRTRYS